MKKITLALGGGGTKGFAHIGVIKIMLQLGYEIAAIAGTSAGGIVGALYGCGYQIAEIEEFAKKMDYTKLFSINISEPPSLLSLNGLFIILKKYIGERTFDSLNIPLAVCAVDNSSGQEYIINSGRVIDGLKATTAVSGVFPPFIHKNLALVDGGVLNPVPVNIARWMNDNVPVVAVSLNAPKDKWSELPRYNIPGYLPIPEFVANQFSHLRISKAMQTFTESLDLMMNMIAYLRLKEDDPDILVVPEVYKHTMYDNVIIQEMIEKGESAASAKAEDFSKAFSMSRRAVRWIKASKPPGKILEW